MPTHALRDEQIEAEKRAFSPPRHPQNVIVVRLQSGVSLEEILSAARRTVVRGIAVAMEALCGDVMAAARVGDLTIGPFLRTNPNERAPLSPKRKGEMRETVRKRERKRCADSVGLSSILPLSSRLI